MDWFGDDEGYIAGYSDPCARDFSCEDCGADIGWKAKLCYHCWPMCTVCDKLAESEDGGMCVYCRTHWCAEHSEVNCQFCIVK